MDRMPLSRLTCALPALLAPAAIEALDELGLTEIYAQGGKSVALREGKARLGIAAPPSLAEQRSEILRILAPREYEAPIARLLFEKLDLGLPGRGTLFAEDAEQVASRAARFDYGRLAALAVPEGKDHKDYSVLCCIVQRGQAEPLCRTLLEMGLCAPLVSFGKGMGLRNKLGLLRVTIPVDKEVLYFVVPSRDADLVSGIASRQARLDLPGRGFIYRYRVRARAVNARILEGGRRHVATMEQVIEALDELRGSTDWRRLAAGSPARDGADDDAAAEGFARRDGTSLSCVSVVCEEGQAADYVRAAMDAGAGGATLVRLSRRGTFDRGRESASRARETCDLIIGDELLEPVLESLRARGLFEPDSGGSAEITKVERPQTYRV